MDTSYQPSCSIDSAHNMSGMMFHIHQHCSAPSLTRPSIGLLLHLGLLLRLPTLP
jgi:hypothetical protein